MKKVRKDSVSVFLFEFSLGVYLENIFLDVQTHLFFVWEVNSYPGNVLFCTNWLAVGPRSCVVTELFSFGFFRGLASYHFPLTACLL